MSKGLTKARKLLWNIASSPKTVAVLKLGAALIGVVHAIEELRDLPSQPKRPVGFRPEED